MFRVFKVSLLTLMVLFHPVNTMLAQAEEIVCIRCHSGLPEKYSRAVKLWRGSVHAENGISCNACHGGDPVDMANAMNPARGFLGAPKERAIPGFCGRCHVGVMKDYLGSAHGKALGKGGPTCVTCHGNHEILKASLELINEKNCTRCHSYERARAIKNSMQQTESMIVTIGAGIADFKQEGVDTDRLEKELFAARNRFHVLFHDVDVEKVKAHSAMINSELTRMKNKLQNLDDVRRKRKITGVIVVAGAFCAALLLHLLKKQLDR